MVHRRDHAALLLATHNENKVEEIREIWADLPLKLMSLRDVGYHDEIVEDGRTLEANAFIKAAAGWRATGMMCAADDSGLFVARLDGRPGVHSARFSGPQATCESNNELLQLLVAGTPTAERTASFRTCVVLIPPQGNPRQLEELGELKRGDGLCYFAFFGSLNGSISDTPRGTHGFGYDPLFYVPEYDRNLAELTPEIKNSISHRYRAFTELEDFLMAYIKQ